MRTQTHTGDGYWVDEIASVKMVIDGVLLTTFTRSNWTLGVHMVKINWSRGSTLNQNQLREYDNVAHGMRLAS